MKQFIKTTLLLVLCFSAFYSTTYAQQSINYKAVLKDNNGNVIANDVVPVQFNILKGVAQTNVYSELHTPTTDGNGIIIINIGDGTLVGGSPLFSTIDWADDSHFLQVLINTGGGLVDMGVTEFNAVPYALSSGDKSWESENDNVHVLSKNVGIGTDSPTELLQINDADTAGIKLAVPSLADRSKIEFRNGLETGNYSFYKIENRSDLLRFELDSDLTTAAGYQAKMTLSNLGLALENGTRVNEFSTDGTLAGNSNTALPTEMAVKTYVDNSIATLETNTKTIIIPASQFVSDESNYDLRYGNSGTFVYKTENNSPLYASIIVPVGSTLTSITFNFRDVNSSPNVNISGSILYAFKSAIFPTLQFTVSTFGASSSGFEETYSTPITVNPDRQYYVRVIPTSVWTNSDLGINSVKVTYTEN